MQNLISSVKITSVRLSPGTIIVVFVAGVLAGALIQGIWPDSEAGGQSSPAAAKPATEPQAHEVEGVLRVSLAVQHGAEIKAGAAEMLEMTTILASARLDDALTDYPLRQRRDRDSMPLYYPTVLDERPGHLARVVVKGGLS